MIKTFIQYNSGKPVVSFRALQSDINSKNALKLLAKAFSHGTPQSLGLTFDPRHVTLGVATGLEKKTHVES